MVIVYRFFFFFFFDIQPNVLRAQASSAMTEHLAQKLKRESEAITGYEHNREEESDEESYEAIQEVNDNMNISYMWLIY